MTAVGFRQRCAGAHLLCDQRRPTAVIDASSCAHRPDVLHRRQPRQPIQPGRSARIGIDDPVTITTATATANSQSSAGPELRTPVSSRTFAVRTRR